jgi:hypothetical protein
MSIRGILCFAIGGALLIFSLYLVFYGALSEIRIQYSSHGPLINGLMIGFVAFILLEIGIHFIISEKKLAKSLTTF